MVPLCGKSVDVHWLAQRYDTVGVELCELAVRAFHEASDRAVTPEEDGAFQAWRSEGLTMLQGDVFELQPRHVEGVDRVWDRAALVALTPDQRSRYVGTLRELLPAGTSILLNALVYDDAVMDGPPHAVGEDEVRTLYAGARVEILDREDQLDERWRSRGHSWFRRDLYHIVL